jgi:beta-glucosidase
MRQHLLHGPVLFSGGLLAFALVVACGHSPATGPAGSNGGTPSSNTGGSGSGLTTSSGGSTNPGAGGTPSSGGTSTSTGGDGEVIHNGGSSPTAGGAGGPAGGDTTMPAGGRMSCMSGVLPTEQTRPGYTTPRPAEVTDLLGKMSRTDKFKQMYGIAYSPPVDYRDIERSLDSDVITSVGKSVLGYRYRDAGRGVNLAAGQDNRPEGDDFSTVFPAQSTRAASWDPDLEFTLGEAMGEETMSSKNNMLLAPCMNIIRHPYWGRTQETYSEDMFHVGRMASGLTAGIQQHVVACAKHFAANNVENNRANQNAVMNEQTLREVYAPHFDMVVREGGVGCIMASYNLINGVKNTQNKHLLSDILKAPVDKGGMGFRGLVLTDWWAMPGDQMPLDTAKAGDQTAEAVKAGLDVEVPWALHFSQLGAVVDSGKLTEQDINESAGRVLEQKARFGSLYKEDGKWGLGTSVTTLNGSSITNNDSHLALAEEAEIKSAVLLSNGAPGAPVLPIKTAKTIAVVGLDLPVTVSSQTELPKSGATMHFATDVNLGDRGSSRVNADPAKSIGPFAGIQAAAMAHGMTVTSGNSAAAAKDADFIVAVVGLTAGDEGEEYSLDSHGDRKSLDLPGGQAQFVNDVLALNKPTAIIVDAGSIVNLPWLSHANKNQATIWAGYGGQRQGAAFGKLLLGDRNFSGKMPMAWPTQADLPPFTEGATSTTMGYFFGYRYYDNKKAMGQPVQLVFPFGHGLSYTTFAYQKPEVPCGDVSKDAVIEVKVAVSNTGPVEGDEIVMLFVSGPPKAATIKGDRAVKELKGFKKINLKAMGTEGDAKRVTIPLRIQDLRHWEGDASGSWVIDEGTYTIMVGPSGDDADLTQKETFTVHG